MILPSFPTDNLYKFIFIAGVIFILSGLFLYSIESAKGILKIQEWEISIVKDSFEIKLAESELYRIKSETDQLTGELRDSNQLTDTQHIVYNDRNSSVNQNRKVSEDMALKLAVEKRIKNLKIQYLFEATEKLKRIFQISLFLVFCGVLLALYGYWKWLILVQRPLDLKLIFEIKEIKNKIQ